MKRRPHRNADAPRHVVTLPPASVNAILREVVGEVRAEYKRPDGLRAAKAAAQRTRGAE